MSKFFAETRKVAGMKRAPDADVTDVDAAVASFKRANRDAHGDKSNEGEVSDLSAQLNEADDISSDVATIRLENCGTIRLPRLDEKTFVVAEYNAEMRVALEAYSTLRTRLDRQQSKMGMRSLVISSAVQGEGKTLTTFNLALCYAKMQKTPILVVDADLRNRGLSRLLGDPDSPGLSNILETATDYSFGILASDWPNLYVLPAGSSSIAPPELFSSQKWSEFIAWTTETFGLVILDCPPVLSVTDFELITVPCDAVILVVRSRKSASSDVSRALSQIDAKKVAGVVFNVTEEPASGYYYPSA